MTMVPRVADRMAATLFQSGIRHAFGMPGGEVTTLIDGLERAGISFVLTRNETAAAMMAAGTCLEAKRPGLLVTTIGPGLANAINGIADSMQERAPLVVISGTIEEKLRGRYTHQVVDHRQLLAPVVKASFEVSGETASAVVARAIRLAMTHPRGPVHIDLSPSLAAAASKEACDGSFVSLRSAAPDPADPLLQAVRARIGAAIRPVILAGHDAVRDPLAATFTELADQFQIPVVTTYKAKGLIDESHPLSIGSAGLSPLADEQILPLLQRADLVLMLGYDPIEMRAGWLDPVGDDSRIIELGPHHDHGMHTAGLRVEGAPVGLLNAILSGAQPKALWPEGEAKGVRDRLRDAFEGPAGWGPHQIFKGLREHLPQDALVSVDSGAHRILLSQIWRSARPFGLAQSSGWCTMGSAIPLAIGRKLSHPDSRVVAVLGDGGLEMTLGELGTLRDQGLALTVLVLQDGSLELIGQKQDQAGLLRRAVAMGRTDYAAIARSFGGQGFQVTSETELAIALRSAADLNGFSLIVCEIADHGYAGWI